MRDMNTRGPTATEASSQRQVLVAAIPRALTVLVPALNEERNLGPTVERLSRALSITIEDFEIIIVNDGSSDLTGEVADKLAATDSRIKVIHNPAPSGLGHAYLQGIDAATKDYFVYIPGDNTWPYRSFVELFGNLGKADVITSYSTNPGVRPPGRRLVSRAYTLTLNTFFGYRLHYFNGLTIYPTAFLRTKPISTYGFGFQAEVLLKALDHGFSYIEVALPIDERTAGASKAVTVRNITSVATTILRLYWSRRILRKDIIPKAANHENLMTESVDAKRLNIVITGASSGIGRELAHALAEDGHLIFACARREKLLQEIAESNPAIVTQACDVTNEDAVHRFVQMIGSKVDFVDVLINCAGGFGAIGPIEQTDSGEWLETLHVNLFGPYLVSKTLLPFFEKSRTPQILNFSGGGAFNAFPNYSAYACSKAAIVRLTECMAAEFAQRGIAVNAIAPGIVATPAHEATLKAGEDKAGILTYRRTKAMLEEGGAPMGNVVDCVRALLHQKLRGLTGKTISANFDPWRTEAFVDHVNAITKSDLYAMRRINIVNLPDGKMRSDLGKAWESFGTDK